VSSFRDVTSFQKAQPDSATITPLFGLSKNKWSGATYRSQDFTDVSFNPVKEVSIPPVNEWTGNSFDRDREVKAFYADVINSISDSAKEPIGKEHSSIYEPLANELNFLSQQKANRKVLLVYSDLMENLPGFSLYHQKDFTLLVKSPDKVRAYFLNKIPLNNLNGIEVFLIYQPENSTDDYQYQIVSKFYKTMLESAGATVIISANLQN
ncbi:MAG TPA: hypothetical protein VK809_13345, partial [Bacteroidia bacterium]|nr:hypothetical protein [Bacteroidia bacterium]